MSYRNKRTLLGIQAMELNASKSKDRPHSDEQHPQSTSRTPISRLSSQSALFVNPSPSQPAPSASRASISILSSQSAPFVRPSPSQPAPSASQAPISRLSSHSAPSQCAPSISRARLTNFSKPPPPDQIANFDISAVFSVECTTTSSKKAYISCKVNVEYGSSIEQKNFHCSFSAKASQVDKYNLFE